MGVKMKTKRLFIKRENKGFNKGVWGAVNPPNSQEASKKTEDITVHSVLSAKPLCDCQMSLGIEYKIARDMSFKEAKVIDVIRNFNFKAKIAKSM